MSTNLIPVEIIESKIFFIRGYKVMLDSDLANLYQVETKVLNQAVKRNIKRFPEDFMFQLTDDEWEVMRSQFVTSKEGKGGRRFNPYVFTQEGIAMLSSVLNSERAIMVNIQIMRTFVKLNKMLTSNEELKQKIEELETKYDQQFAIVFEAIRQLIEAPEEPRKPLGFRTEEG